MIHDHGDHNDASIVMRRNEIEQESNVCYINCDYIVMIVICVGNRMLGNRQAKMHASIFFIKKSCKIKTLGGSVFREHTQESVEPNYRIKEE